MSTPLPDLLADLRARHDALLDENRGAEVRRQHDRGKLTARERIAALCGHGRFYEWGALAGPGPAQDGEPPLHAPGDGVVTGVGDIDGRPAAIAAFDFTVLGGSNGAVGLSKVERCADRALEDGMPFVLICDGGGHRMQEGLDSRLAGPGSTLLHRLVDLSGHVPTLTVILGPGFGAAANMAAVSDFVVIARGIGQLAMSSAPFVRAATGLELTNEEIGGAEIQAARGIAHLAVDDEHEALDAVRAYLSFLPANADEEPLRAQAPWEPGADDSTTDAIIPASARQAYDVRRLVEALSDAESVFELSPTAAPNLVTAMARIEGRSIGLVANQPIHLGGTLDSAACEKAAHFIAVCDAFGLPLVILIDVPGFLIGPDAEATQLARRSGRLMYELGQATVPLVTVATRRGYGAGYVAMGGGRSNAATLSLAWPTAEICAMPIEGAVDIAYRRQIAEADDPLAARSDLIDRFRANIDAYRAADGFGVDAVVAPSETRDYISETLRRAPRRRPARVPGKRRTISPI